VEWFLMDGDDTEALIGSSTDPDEVAPGSDFLLEDSTAVDSVLKLSPHVHNGISVPVANPSIAAAHEYMNAIENSHYVYLAYQALEDSKWNIYMRQIRLSEYSRQDQTNLDTAEFANLNELGISELIYRIVCVNDGCDSFGADFLASRTITMEVVLQDGREVFNEGLDENAGSWNVCPGSPAGDFPKKKTFVEFTHSVTVNKCPDQFEFNDIFYNWNVGDEFLVPFSDLSPELFFTLFIKPNDSAVSLGDSTVTISGLTITSSQAGVVWFEHPTVANWMTIDPTTLQGMLQYKGLDVSEPIPLTSFEDGHCTHPVVKVNADNDVYVAYECTDPTLHQIHIVGTAVPSSSLPIGIITPKNLDASLDYFLNFDDFVYKYQVTATGDGINQLPDIYIDLNDVVHLSWQSNRDNYWEIYYANSTTGFTVKRITNFKSRSFKPQISGDERGNIHIVWHDDRFGNWEILMAYLDGHRVPTLAEQDPYMAMVRNEGYNHYTDIAPLTLANPSSTEVLCFYDISARFYTDRLLDNVSFVVNQREFPEAFQIPGLGTDRTSLSVSYPEFSDWAETSEGNQGVHAEWLSPVLDTGLAGAVLESFSITFDPAFVPRRMYFDFGASPETEVRSPWLDISGFSSGETVLYSAVPLLFDENEVDPEGRYIQIYLGASGTPSVSTIANITMNFVRKDRLCITPGETVTGYLDMTPIIRKDAEGIETVEMPLPVEAEANVVYFLALTAASSTGLHVFGEQQRSVSCESCTRDSSLWDSASCSIHVRLANEGNTPQFYNVRVRFYTDQEKQNIIAQFEAFKDADGQLELFSLENNQPADELWDNIGLEIPGAQSRTVTLWPLLSNTAGLLCGVTYWVEVFVCSGTLADPCDRSGLISSSFNKWVCQCESSRLDANAPTNILDVVRWSSSGDGFSDTRLTETGDINNWNPRIQIRSDLTGLVVYESNRDDPNRLISENDIHSLYVTAFSIFPTSRMYASGAESVVSPSPLDEVSTVHLIKSDVPITGCDGTDCNDTGAAIQARNVSFALDQYDNIFLAAEQQHDQSVCEEFDKDKQQNIIVHRCGAQARNLIFSTEQAAGADFGCDSDNILNKVAPLSEDRTFRQTIRMVRVSNESAKYHITRKGKSAAVVEQCGIVLEAIVEPETVAVRVRNEQDAWSVWYPFHPELLENMMKIPWELSPGSGVKGITVQSATYQGLASTFSIIVIADYNSIDHTVRFYKSSVVIPEQGKEDDFISVPQSGQTEASDLLEVLDVELGKTSDETVFNEDNLLSSLEGVPVAGIRQPVSQTLVDLSTTVIVSTSEFIFVEISVSQTYLDDLGIKEASDKDKLTPTFDVLQQGQKDLFSMPMRYDAVSNTFRGVFPIWKDDKTLYQDGLSFIIPHFKLDCSDASLEVLAAEQYIRDKHNVVVPGRAEAVVETQTSDIWATERDELGKVKYPFDIRGIEDPYFVFGDPNYRLKKET
jgi:hypothetical protein